MKNKIIEILSVVLNKNKKYVKSFLTKVFEIMKRPEMKVLPGHLAFSILLSFIPIVSILTAIGSALGVNITAVGNILGEIFTSVHFDLIIPQLVGQEISQKYIIIILIMFFIAGNGASSIIIASNQIYGIKDSTW